MRRYETTFILRPSLNEEEINTVTERSSGIIEDRGGRIIELDRWGMKKLAYQIKKETQGFYVFCDYSGTPEAVAEMERRFRIDDAVLRYMTIKTADSISEEEIAEATKKIAEKQAGTEETAPTDEETAEQPEKKSDSASEESEDTTSEQ